MTSFYCKHLYVDVTGKDKIFLNGRSSECEEMSKASQRRMVNYASQRTVHFLSKGISGKCSSTVWKLNSLLGTLLLAEEGEKKPVSYLEIGFLFRRFREKRLTVVQSCSHKPSFCLYWNETTNSQENFLTV